MVVVTRATNEKARLYVRGGASVMEEAHFPSFCLLAAYSQASTVASPNLQTAFYSSWSPEGPLLLILGFTASKTEGWHLKKSQYYKELPI